MARHSISASGGHAQTESFMFSDKQKSCSTTRVWPPWPPITSAAVGGLLKLDGTPRVLEPGLAQELGCVLSAFFDRRFVYDRGRWLLDATREVPQASIDGVPQTTRQCKAAGNRRHGFYGMCIAHCAGMKADWSLRS